MADYWWGVATPFAIILAGWVVLSVYAWVSWWFIDHDAQFVGGWGYHHELQVLDEGRWSYVQHTHWWPPDTPRWLGRRLERLRVWLCLRKPNHRKSER